VVVTICYENDRRVPLAIGTIGAKNDPWEQDCHEQVAAALGGKEFTAENWPQICDRLGMIKVGEAVGLGKIALYRRAIDMERLVRWHSDKTFTLSPAEWT